MGKLARTACITLPMLFTVASLLCLFLVCLGGQMRGSSLIRSLYYLKIDTSQFDPSPPSSLFVTDDEDGNSLLTFENDKIKDVYTLHLWNYCSGMIGPKKDDGEGGQADDDNDVEKREEEAESNEREAKIDFCSSNRIGFYFDPREEWGLDTDSETVPSRLRDALRVYAAVAKWQFVAYMVALGATAASIIVGLLAVCSRLGSVVTGLVAGVALAFTLAASITSTLLHSALLGALTATLRPYGVRGSLGRSMLSTTWLAVAFSSLALITWVISACCVSGRSRKSPTSYPYHATPLQSAPGATAYSSTPAAAVTRSPAKSRKGSGLLNAVSSRLPWSSGHGKLASSKNTGYERVASPYMGPSAASSQRQQYPFYQNQNIPPQQQGVALTDFAAARQSRDGFGSAGGYDRRSRNEVYEPFRHV